MTKSGSQAFVQRDKYSISNSCEKNSFMKNSKKQIFSLPHKIIVFCKESSFNVQGISFWSKKKIF